MDIARIFNPNVTHRTYPQNPIPILNCLTGADDRSFFPNFRDHFSWK